MTFIDTWISEGYSRVCAATAVAEVGARTSSLCGQVGAARAGALCSHFCKGKYVVSPSPRLAPIATNVTGLVLALTAAPYHTEHYVRTSVYVAFPNKSISQLSVRSISGARTVGHFLGAPLLGNDPAE